MKMRPLAVATAMTLSVALAGIANAADKPEAKSDNAKQETYVCSCPSPCDFTVKSHDKAEVAAVVKTHAKTHHNMDMSDKDVEAMIKTKGQKQKES